MKTLFFNWEKIVKTNKHSLPKILKVFSSFAKVGYVPADMAGHSYILNVFELIDSNYSGSEKLEYIMLAAIRNYFDYEYQGNSGLWLPMSPIDSVKINKNRLLHIENDFIKFKFEE